MNGALARRASRRAISVLPTPVGPIMRMFFGVISGRNDSATCWRRQRLRKAIATARFAAFWPTMCLSSSSPVSRGVICDIQELLLQFLNRQIAIGIDANVRRNVQRALDDVARRKVALHEGQRRRLRKAAARTNGDQVMLRLDDIAGARDDISAVGIRHAEQRFQTPQAAIAAPVLGQLNGRAGQVAELLQLALEALEQ